MNKGGIGVFELPEDYFDIDENFEFNTGINKLLDQEVEKRLSERVKGYEEAIKRDENSQEEICSLKKEIRQLKIELDKSEEHFKKQGKDETLRNLLGGFKLGDEVWFVSRIYNHAECQTCLGERNIIVDFKSKEMKVECPECRGLGRVSYITKSAEKGIVQEIKMHTWADGRRFEVKMYIKPTSYKSHDSVSARNGEFFKTKEECEIYLENNE